jgi:hypothetical protein
MSKPRSVKLISNPAEGCGGTPVADMPTFWAKPIPAFPKGRRREIAEMMIAFFIVLSFWVNDFVVVCKGEKFFALTYQNLIPRPLLLAKRRGEWYNFFSVR